MKITLLQFQVKVASIHERGFSNEQENVLLNTSLNQEVFGQFIHESEGISL